MRQKEIEREAIKREGDEKRIEELTREIDEINSERTELRAKWQTQRDLIEKVQVERKLIDDYKQQAAEAERQLAEYFAGKRRRFELPLRLCGTDFRLRVWNALADIPFGSTVSYSGIAAAAGSPKACRAAGNAVGKNPFLIVLPCHRVVASDGTVGGFSADINIKKYLLEFEKNIL